MGTHVQVSQARDCRRAVARQPARPCHVPREREIVNREYRHHHDGAFLRKDADGRRQPDGRQPCGPPQTNSSQRLPMAQQRGHDSECRQQIRPPHNIGDRFGQHGMHSPESGEHQRVGGTPRFASEDLEPQQIYQHDIRGMQQEIEAVISVGIGPVPQHGVVEEE